MKILKNIGWSDKLTCANCAAVYEANQDDVEAFVQKAYSNDYTICYVPCPACGFTFDHERESKDLDDWRYDAAYTLYWKGSVKGNILNLPLEVIYKAKLKFNGKIHALNILRTELFGTLTTEELLQLIENVKARKLAP